MSAGLVLHCQPSQVYPDYTTVLTGANHRVEIARERFTKVVDFDRRKPPQSDHNILWQSRTPWSATRPLTPRKSSPQMTALYACLYAREFPAQAMLRLRPQLRESPVAVLVGTAPRQWVCSLNARAAALGIEAGLTRAELEVFPSVALLPRSLAEEASARAALLQCAGQFSPRVECLTHCHPERSAAESRDLLFLTSDTHFCAILDIAGTEKLLGPPEKLAKKLLHSVRVLGIHATVVVSANLDAALCLARNLPIRTAIIPTGEEAKTLAPLPLSVLTLTPEHAETFARWGIATLGALAALPEKELIARLGQEGRRLRQFARGQAPHLLVPADPPSLSKSASNSTRP